MQLLLSYKSQKGRRLFALDIAKWYFNLFIAAGLDWFFSISEKAAVWAFNSCIKFTSAVLTKWNWQLIMTEKVGSNSYWWLCRYSFSFLTLLPFYFSLLLLFPVFLSFHSSLLYHSSFLSFLSFFLPSFSALLFTELQNYRLLEFRRNESLKVIWSKAPIQPFSQDRVQMAFQQLHPFR